MSLREPFHFRYMREIVGVFVLGSVAVGIATLVALGNAQRWFERRVEVRAAFAPEKVTVVHPGVPVRLAGENVGQVVDVKVEKDRQAHVRMKVRLTAREALRADSSAILRVPIAGLVGDLAIELTPGGDAPPFGDGDELPGLTQGDLLAELEGVLRELGRDLPALTSEAAALLGHLNGILAQAEKGEAGRHAAALLARSAAVTAQIERERVVARTAAAIGEVEKVLAAVEGGEGTAGKIVRDPAFHDRVARLLDDLHASWADLSRVLAAAGRIGDDGAAVSAELRKRAEDLPALLDQTQRLLLRTNQTLEAMQRHWLLRGSVEAPSPLPDPPAVLDRAAPLPAKAPPGGGAP
jgi:phospholipid/cholesterol/gamma-HCH transport system substrate-binding protein